MMKLLKWSFISLLVLIPVVIGVLSLIKPRISYIPSEEKVLNRERFPLDFQDQEIKVTPELVKKGREAFYQESFGNEKFLTDVVGVLSGPLTLWSFTKALLKLAFRGTTDLKVTLAKDLQIGDRLYKEGEEISTGLDVPKGSILPMGLPLKLEGFKVKAGISCALCHSTVDEKSGMVVEGAPNNNLNAGLIIAMATNSAAYFTHTGIKSLRKFHSEFSTIINNTKGQHEKLPDKEKLERMTDIFLASWPPGSFDSTSDLENNPSQIPDSFTRGDFPYGWSGNAFGGPFQGLSTLNNNVHSQNADSLSQADSSQILFGIDKEVYVATILQNAANTDWRYPRDSLLKPSEFMQKIDPTPPNPGMNEDVQVKNYPRISPLTLNGHFLTKKGKIFWEDVNAMSAFQNTLKPIDRFPASHNDLLKGQEIFQKANCQSCHQGEYFTNNKVLAADVIGTEPSRARAFKRTEPLMGEPLRFPFDAEYPEETKTIKDERVALSPKEQTLALAYKKTEGGYKVPSLIGLAWTAPFLHDGGVAASETQQGLMDTMENDESPDPFYSLLGLIDRRLRKMIVRSNFQDPATGLSHVQGVGHEFWIDEENGFNREDQKAVILYLLNLNDTKK